MADRLVPLDRDEHKRSLLALRFSVSIAAEVAVLEDLDSDSVSSFSNLIVARLTLCERGWRTARLSRTRSKDAERLKL